MNSEQSSVLKLVDLEEYESALAKIAHMPQDLQQHGRIIIAKADAYYELSKDLEALEAYANYVKLYPDGQGVDFALFGAAMCLKNLDLQLEAQHLLARIKPTHVGIEKELQHSKQVLEKQMKARSFLQIINFNCLSST